MFNVVVRKVKTRLKISESNLPNREVRSTPTDTKFRAARNNRGLSASAGIYVK
jgi:hypothetical protein